MTDSGLTEQSFTVGSTWRVELDETGVSIYEAATEAPDDGEYSVALTPTTRREASQLAIALRHASRRMDAIGRGLP